MIVIVIWFSCGPATQALLPPEQQITQQIILYLNHNQTQKYIYTCFCPTLASLKIGDHSFVFALIYHFRLLGVHIPRYKQL